MAMNLQEVVDLCLTLVPDLWKMEQGTEVKYDDGKLHVVAFLDDYLGAKEVLASYENKQFLWYREHYADSKYVYNSLFENHVASETFIAYLAKTYLISP